MKYDPEHYQRNKERIRAYQRAYYAKHCDKMYADAVAKQRRNKAAYYLIYKKSRMKRRYGFSLDKYYEMLTTQGGRCGVCKSASPGKSKGEVERDFFCVDHNHATGEIRGLLCVNCNWCLKQRVGYGNGPVLEYLQGRDAT